ncbi:hypothetical protein AALC17_02970 [Oscillospiraceae bacterium 38-13]
MNRFGRMFLMASGRENRRQNPGVFDDPRSDSHMTRDWDDQPESRFRDRRGREHYDNGRFAPQNDGGMWVESRYWDDAFRSPESRFSTPYVPPVYQDYSERRGPMNKIGFAMEGEMDRIPPEFHREYRTDARHHSMDETAYRHGGDRMSGHSSGSSGAPFTREMAQEWVQRMRNADGTTGPHWTMEKTEEARAQRGITCDPLAFWVAMNMIYSDYSKVAEKVNANSMDFYVYMAKAFLEDRDARNQGGDKLARYYEYVVL